MTLDHLIPAIARDPLVTTLLGRIERLQRGRSITVSSVSTTVRAPLLAALIATLAKPVIIVTPREDLADELVAGLSEYLESDQRPYRWPTPEMLPYEQLPIDRSASAQRISLLTRLLAGDPVSAIVPARALMQQISPPHTLRDQTHTLRVGDRVRLDALIGALVDQGYDLVPLVTAPGQVARRGSLIDVFPAGADNPVRIDLFGDEIESLRLFDPASQLSLDRLPSVSLVPPFEIDLTRRDEAVAALERFDASTLRPEVSEEWQRTLRRLEAGAPTVAPDLFAPFLLPQPASVLDYLPDDHLVIVIEPGSVRLSLEQTARQAEELRETLEQAGELPVGLPRPYFAWPKIAERLGSARQVCLGDIPVGWMPPAVDVVDEPSGFGATLPNFAGRMSDLVEQVAHRLRDDWAVVIATEQSRRVGELLEEAGIYPRLRKRGALATSTAPPPPRSVEVVHSPLQGGWAHDLLHVMLLTDRELFGFRHATRAQRRPAVTEPSADLLTRLTAGDYVVHIDHGIARYGGLVKLEVSGVEREYLLLEYAANDRLYLPVDQIDRITLYEGGGVEPKLTRLGSPEWSRVKRRVRAAVREMAFELLQLYAARESAQGNAFPPDTAWDRELEESFPYPETPDQLRAINEVKHDLEQPRPMDRLVCGDVGYGKTEVALRAAFKAVNAGFQVAILVPTTVLALQHFRSFRERLAPFPVRVEMLSRLRSKPEQAAIVRDLDDGKIDIVIGTHRLLQKDIRFQRLGLLVIDEEQRFGVAHKEQLKRVRTDVHVLTMTATPIPRTLHMALAGIRDLSVISTPPRDRTPIRTFVTGDSDALVREAILREIDRGGQVFFVHNRVQSIGHVLQRLRKLVPEARVTVGHGQMDERELERVILAFVEHEFDVLLCTTIIESGVDIPNVNTIIIDRAHTLGLTQLYQLRGRVGRGHQRAYAYLLYDPSAPLSQEAVARLEAIQEATELGAGFQIALRDMEIRGAGNILGAEQSGHIAAVGFDLYTQMLAKAVEEVKQGRPIEEPEAVTVDLPIEAVIPDWYTGSEEVRIAVYRRVASARTNAELRDVVEELIDRFGPLPEGVQRLVELARLRIRASRLGITAIVEREGEIYIRPVVGSRLSQPALRRAIGDGVTVTPNQVRLTVDRLATDRWTAVQRVIAAVEEADATVLAAAG